MAGILILKDGRRVLIVGPEPPNFYAWLRMDRWSYDDLACLMVGCHPRATDEIHRSPDFGAEGDIETANLIASTAARSNAWQSANGYMTPIRALEWARANGFVMPAALATALRRWSSDVISQSKTASRTTKPEKECRKWLLALMKANRSPQFPKAVYLKNAVAEFSISKSAFNRAWADSIRESESSEWSAPGRKPSTKKRG